MPNPAVRIRFYKDAKKDTLGRLFNVWWRRAFIDITDLFDAVSNNQA